MKSLKTYFECGECGSGDVVATPANTMGMGNPGQIDNDTLTEPVTTAKAEKKKKKKRVKPLAESLFDTDLVEKNPCYATFYDFEEWDGSIYDMGRIDEVVEKAFSIFNMRDELRKSFWKKFIRYEDDWTSHKHDYFYDEFWYHLTQVIMSCSTFKEIEHQLYNIIELSREKSLDKKEGDYIKDIEVHAIPKPRSKTDLRMVVVKFNCLDPAYNTVTWATFNKKEQ